MEATCTSAKRCMICGTASGDPLGHVGSGESCLDPIQCEVCGEKFVAYDSHAWVDATCTEAKTCSVCGQIDGEPAGHDYTAVALGDGTHTLICQNNQRHQQTENCYGGQATCLDVANCEACGSAYGEIGTHGWLEATCTEPETCKWCGLADGEPNGHDYDYSNGQCRNCDDTVSIVLYTSTDTCVVESTYQTMVFYAEIAIDAEITSVDLYDSEGTRLATMYDDGNYQSNRDEFSNDGVFTCQISINTNTQREIGFCVVLNNDTAAVSNVHTIKWVERMTSQEIANMESVEIKIEAVLAEEVFAELEEEEKQAIVEEAIEVLESSALIVEDSVIFDSKNGTFTFVYESGALGAISIKNWVDTSEPEFPEVGETDEDLFTDIDAIILWSFNQVVDDDSVRSPFYNDLVQEWLAKGLDPTLDKEVTVEDYKNLKGYEIILISSHGAYYEYKVGHTRTKLIPGIILSEEATQAKDSLYANDLRMQRIAKFTFQGGTKYVILPAFWEYYYGGGALDGSFVISESCEFFGVNGSEDHSMANAILNCAAEGVLGYKNSVLMKYSRNFASLFIESLVDGHSATEAFAIAKSVYGDSDYCPGREFYGPSAYPIYLGQNAYLVNSNLENGSFEENPNLIGWTTEGDIRVLNKLGDLSPTDENKMAILTTGVGSGTSDYVGATEGSVLSQIVLVNAGNTVLSFDYNVVSEEPHEYVGSKYDDKMYVEIIDQYGNKIEVCAESVNASTWYSVSGINFEGGDTTCYETGWKTVNFDISQYQGQFITIRFVVYDVGDSAYDTAALIDNVAIN